VTSSWSFIRQLWHSRVWLHNLSSRHDEAKRPFSPLCDKTCEKGWTWRRRHRSLAKFRGPFFTQQHIHTAPQDYFEKKIFSVEVLEMKYSVQQAVRPHFAVTV